MKKSIVSLLFNSTTLVAVLFSIIILSSEAVISAGTLLNVANGFIGGVRNEVSSFRDVDDNIALVFIASCLIFITILLTIQEKQKTKSVQKIK